MRRLILAGRGQAPVSAASAARRPRGCPVFVRGPRGGGTTPHAPLGPCPLSSPVRSLCLDPRVVGEFFRASFALIRRGNAPACSASRVLASPTGPARPPRTRISRRPPLPPRRGPSHVPVRAPPRPH